MGPTIDGARRILRLEIGQLKIEITKSQIGPARVTGGGWHRQQNLRFCNFGFELSDFQSQNSSGPVNREPDPLLTGQWLLP